jgi:hypothetical protein
VPHWNGQEGSVIPAALSLSALTLDVVVALAQRPNGAGATDLARMVRGAPTSVQNCLKLLVTHGLLDRDGLDYRLRREHPAMPELVALGLRLPDPLDAIRIVVRANDAVEFAAVDDGGYIVGTAASPSPAVAGILDDSLETIRRGRTPPPHILQFPMEDLVRILRSAMGLRGRLAAAQIEKGGIRRLSQMGEAPPDAGTSGRTQIS